MLTEHLRTAGGADCTQIARLRPIGQITFGSSRAQPWRERPCEERQGRALGHIHGLNEYVGVKSLLEGREFLYYLVKNYAEQQ